VVTYAPAHEPERVVNWRFEALLNAGFRPWLAKRIAEDLTIDLHLACQLLKSGATQLQALKILF
jgi:hypothetical protein